MVARKMSPKSSLPISYKILNKDDLSLICQIGDDVFDGPVIPAQAKAFLASDLHTMAVAMDGRRVIGMASAVTMLHPDKDPIVFIQEVGVHDGYLRRGIGKSLTKHLMDHLRHDGELDIWLATEDDNTAARALYHSLDARETKGIVVYDWGTAMDDD